LVVVAVVDVAPVASAVVAVDAARVAMVVVAVTASAAVAIVIAAAAVAVDAGPGNSYRKLIYKIQENTRFAQTGVFIFVVRLLNSLARDENAAVFGDVNRAVLLD